MPKSKSRKYYAVRVGRNPGVYDTWDECKAQVDGFPKAVFKSFGTAEEACEFANGSKSSTSNYTAQQPNYQQQQQSNVHTTHQELTQLIAQTLYNRLGTPQSSSSSISIPFPPTVTNVNLDALVVKDASRTILAYTDGSCFNNGSKTKLVVGGIGVYFANEEVDHISEPYIDTRVTNQRCELAAIKACLTSVANLNKYLIIYSDSQYSIKCLQNWMFGWEKKGWITSQGTPVENMDLLEEIIDLIATRYAQHGKGVQFIHVRGHQNDVGNNMADRLAVAGSKKSLAK